MHTWRCIGSELRGARGWRSRGWRGAIRLRRGGWIRCLKTDAGCQASACHCCPVIAWGTGAVMERGLCVRGDPHLAMVLPDMGHPAMNGARNGRGLWTPTSVDSAARYGAPSLVPLMRSIEACPHLAFRMWDGTPTIYHWRWCRKCLVRPVHAFRRFRNSSRTKNRKSRGRV